MPKFDKFIVMSDSDSPIATNEDEMLSQNAKKIYD